MTTGREKRGEKDDQKAFTSILTVATLVAGSLMTGAGTADAASGRICCQARVRTKGRFPWTRDAGTASTTGQALHLEALRVRVSTGRACFTAHRSHYGWGDHAECVESGEDLPGFRWAS